MKDIPFMTELTKAKWTNECNEIEPTIVKMMHMQKRIPADLQQLKSGGSWSFSNPSVSEALQVGPQLLRERQVPGIKAFDLVDRGAGVLGQREDVDLAAGVDEPLAE